MLEQLRAFVEELGLVWTTTTGEADLKKMILTAAHAVDSKMLSSPLQAYLEEQHQLANDEQDCFGKYHDATAPECRRCLEAGNCEILSKGLTTVAFLAGRIKPGPLPKQLGGPGKPAVAKTLDKNQVAPKVQTYMDWMSTSLSGVQLVPKAVYWVAKKNNQNVVTIESVENTGPKFEVLFNRLKDLNLIGGTEPDFKKKYDGWYYVGESLEDLKRFTEAWWRLLK